ncbi:MAG: hypothetical protein PVS3B1_13160 [Ktedonobacteraceae bacterium]
MLVVQKGFGNIAGKWYAKTDFLNGELPIVTYSIWTLTASMVSAYNRYCPVVCGKEALCFMKSRYRTLYKQQLNMFEHI